MMIIIRFIRAIREIGFAEVKVRIKKFVQWLMLYRSKKKRL